MSELFKFPKNIDDMTKANSIFSFIVNRANEFNKKKFNRICLEMPNNYAGHVAYQTALTIAAVSDGLKIYTPFTWKKPYFYKRCKVVKRVPRFIYNHIVKKENSILWCPYVISSMIENHDELGAPIFAQLDADDIMFVEQTLFPKEDKYGCSNNASV